jgi:hypothetical protein
MEKKKITKKQANQKLARLVKQNKDERAKFKHIKLNFMENRFGPLVFVLLFAGIGGYYILNSSASPLPSKGTTSDGSNSTMGREATASIWLQPAAQTVANGSTVSAEVWIDTSETPVNAVEADLTYPTDMLQFVNIDASSSAFGVQAQADGANGKIVIARGTISPVKGRQLVAKVNFKSIAASGHAIVGISSNSSVLSSSDNANVLSKRTGADYTLTN